MAMVDAFLNKMYRSNPGFVFTVALIWTVVGPTQGVDSGK